MIAIFMTANGFMGKLESFVASGKWWPILICLVLAGAVLLTTGKYKQVKKAAQLFNSGATDDETVRLFQKLKHRNRRPKNAQMHDVFCCTLCAMHLERKEDDLFFENLNSIKALTGKITWRVNLLLVAYLTEQRYLDLSAAYKAQKEEDQNVQDWIFQQEDLSYEVQRLETANAKITKSQILEILNSLTDEE